LIIKNHSLFLYRIALMLLIGAVITLFVAHYQTLGALRQSQKQQSFSTAKIKQMSIEKGQLQMELSHIEFTLDLARRSKDQMEAENTRLCIEKAEMKAELRYWMARAAPSSLFQSPVPGVPRPGAYSGVVEIDEKR
jgi:uncharacterized membrane protein